MLENIGEALKMEEIFWKIFEKTGDITSYLLYSQIKSSNGVEGNGKPEKRRGQDSTYSGNSTPIH